jgi:hypothetical protein
MLALLTRFIFQRKVDQSVVVRISLVKPWSSQYLAAGLGISTLDCVLPETEPDTVTLIVKVFVGCEGSW